MKARVAIAVLGALLLVAGGLAIAYLAPEHDYSDEELRAFGFTALPAPRAIDDFSLADARGAPFGPERLRGRWSLLFFGYANCPDICPITLAVLGEADALLRESGRESFRGVFVSVDPERDTPANLARYVAAFSEDFAGVTGEPGALAAFARSLHVGYSKVEVEDSALDYLLDHSSHVAVVDPQGRHVGFVRSPLEAQRIATLMGALAQRDSIFIDPSV